MDERKMATLAAVLALVLFNAMVSASKLSAAAPVNCSSIVWNLANCSSFLTTNNKPKTSCCSGLKTMVKADPKCLCETFRNNGTHDSLNETKALGLLAACNISAPSSLISSCISPASLWGVNGGDGQNQRQHIGPSLAAAFILIIIGVFGIPIVAGASVVLIIMFRNHRIRIPSLKKPKHNQVLEDFINKNGFLASKRYSYLQLKKMTNSFQNPLGEGGFGKVYRGTLIDDGSRPVAVKILKSTNKSSNNGEEFINEVLNISRTSHINVVTLLGFCIDREKRALVYEFMPNGSLEKFIYKQNNNNLGWERLYQIALGVARGLEYLHKGCNTRILHFDIKPHNILLDKNFCPKISDFGLAKECTRKESIISMIETRGTIGYIAPELISRNFGGVSHKSDVYSYGMMVLEMVGGRKNVSAQVSHISEIYFPHWAYHHMVVGGGGGEDLKFQGVMSEEENEIAKKMIFVGLWCIQNDPLQRPAISKVIDMLEGSLDTLEIPPKPFFCSSSRSQVDSYEGIVEIRG